MEDPKADQRLYCFAKLCSRHPMCIQAAVFLLPSPYDLNPQNRLPTQLTQGPEGLHELDQLLYARFLGTDDENMRYYCG